MKKSRYNVLVKEGRQFLLFNAATDCLSVLDPKLETLYSQEDIEHINDRHPEFYQFLCNRGFLVDDNIDEAGEYIKSLEKKDASKESFGITINPTLNCNMRCWYCYEKHNSRANMKKEVFDSVIRLVQNKVAEPELKSLSISFFGGEPLLSFKNVVLPLMQEAKSLCKKASKELHVSFVTNAYLLTEEVLTALDNVGLKHPMAMQITLDGNRKTHNLVRHTADGTGSFDTIVENIKNALRHNVIVNLRLNTTAKSISSFADIVNDFNDLSDEDKKRMTIDIHRVWQDSANGQNKEAFEEQEDNLRSTLKNHGFLVKNKLRLQRYRCYADSENEVVVNYDGNLFRCTARDFTTERAEGKLLPSGELQMNELSKKRTDIKFGNNYCRSCVVYPLCLGGCSQNKLESNNTGSCYYGYSKVDIAEYLQEYIKTKLNNTLKK